MPDLSTLTPEEKLDLARVLYGEAGGEGALGQRAVLDVILNRARASGQSIPQVVNTQGAFESWDNPATRAKLEALSAAVLRPELGVIGGVGSAPPAVGPNTMYFLNPELQASLGRSQPGWAQGAGQRIGNQVFFSGPYQGGAQMAGDPAAGVGGGTAPSPYLQAALAALGPQLAPLQKQAEAATQAESAQLGQTRQVEEAIAKRVGEAPAAPTPPEAPPLQPEPEGHPGDPTRVLGETLPMLAILGGALARKHSLAGLAAATGAMNAAKANDLDALQRHHQAWLDNMKAIQDHYSARQQQFQDIMEANKENLQNLNSELGVFAAMDQNAQAQALAAQGRVKDAVDLWRMQFDAVDRLTSSQQRGEEIALKRQEITAQQLDPTTQDFWAYNALAGNIIKPPSTGMQGGPMRAAMMTKIAQDAIQKYGGGDPTKGIPADPRLAAAGAVAEATGIEADKKNLDNLAKMRGGMAAYVYSFDKISDMAEQAAGPGTANEWGSFWNKPIRAALAAGVFSPADPRVTKLNNLILSLDAEYGKIASGSTGSVRPVSDQMFQKMHEVINGDMTISQIYTNIQTMQQESQTRMDGVNNQVDEATRDIYSHAAQRAGTSPGDEEQETITPQKPSTLAPLTRDEIYQSTINARRAIRAGKVSKEAAAAKLRAGGFTEDEIEKALEGM